MTVHRESLADTEVRKMGIYLECGGKRGVRIQGDGRIHLEKVEHGQVFHSYVISYGPVW